MNIPFLLNWYLNPYHIPLLVAKELGYYKDAGINLTLLEPLNPSDVTITIGENHIPIGLKAMIHCYAARSRNYKIKSIGTLLDEPPTGLISLKSSNIESINDIKGKRLGYIGEFGKIIIDNLAASASIKPHEYETIRVGMDAASAVLNKTVDAAIGLSCFQELEISEANMPTNFLRIDQIANLGCCCFCSIMFIAHEDFIKNNPAVVKNFMQASYKGVLFTRENPKEAFKYLCQTKPKLNNKLFNKIFYHTLPFFSRELKNIERDWNKVGAYAKKLKIVENTCESSSCYTKEFSPEINLDITI